MALAAALAFGYANIFVTGARARRGPLACSRDLLARSAPHVDNLATLFEFTLKALDALK